MCPNDFPLLFPIFPSVLRDRQGADEGFEVLRQALWRMRLVSLPSLVEQADSHLLDECCRGMWGTLLTKWQKKEFPQELWKWWVLFYICKAEALGKSCLLKQDPMPQLHWSRNPWPAQATFLWLSLVSARAFTYTILINSLRNPNSKHSAFPTSLPPASTHSAEGVNRSDVSMATVNQISSWGSASNVGFLIVPVLGSVRCVTPRWQYLTISSGSSMMRWLALAPSPPETVISCELQQAAPLMG